MSGIASERYIRKGEVGGHVAESVGSGRFRVKRSIIPGTWVIRHEVMASGSPNEIEPVELYVAKTRVFAKSRDVALTKGRNRLEA